MSLSTTSSQQGAAVLNNTDAGNFIDMLTNQFLAMEVNHESAAETQAYLVEKILPSLVIGLQRLLITVKTKNIDLETGLLSKEDHLSDPNNASDVAASHETPQTPKTQFNPIIWLAQHLYRHNPHRIKEAGAGSLTRAEKSYLATLSVISKQLHERIKETARLRKERFEALKAEREAERERRRKAREEAERKRSQLIATSIPQMFQSFTNALWRHASPFLDQSNIDEIFRILINSPSLTDLTSSFNIAKKSFGAKVAANAKIYAKDFEAIFSDVFKLTGRVHFVALVQGWSEAVLQIQRELQNDLNDVMFLPAFGNKSPQVFTSIEHFKGHLLKDSFSNDISNVFYAPLAEFISQEDPLYYAKLMRIDTGFLQDSGNEPVVRLEQEWNSFVKFAVGQTSTQECRNALKDLYERLGKVTKADSQAVYQAYLLQKEKEAQQIKAQEESVKVAETQEKIRQDQNRGKDQDQNQTAQTSEAEKQRRTVEIQRLLQKLQDLISMGALKSTFHGFLGMILKSASTMLTSKSAPDHVYELLSSQIGEIQESPEDKGQLYSYFLQTGNRINEVLAGINATDFNAFHGDFWAQLAGIESFHVAVQEKIRNRREMESKCQGELSSLTKRIDISMTKLCELTITALERFFRNYYPTFSAYISLLEKPPASEKSSIFQSTRLRYVACSSKDRSYLLNKTLLPGDGVSFDIMAEKEPRFVANVRDPDVPIKLFGLSNEERNRPEGSFTKRGSYYGIPLFHIGAAQKEAIGMLGMDNIDVYDSTADVAVFKEEDLAIAASAGAKLSECLDRMDKRSKLATLALNSMKWTAPTVDVDIDFYMVEHDTIMDDGQKRSVSYMWQVQQQKDGAQPLYESISTESFERMYLWQCVDSKAKVTDKAAYGKGAIAYPVLRGGQVVGVFSVRSKGDAEATETILSADQIKDMEDILAVLTNAVGNLKTMAFGQMGPSILAAEKFDEVTRNNLLFPRLMLQNARDSISKLDAAAIAEIKSYRKPPPVIHRVLKCVLYIFGKKRKQLLRWIDSSKLLNADLMKAIVEYDPTTVQKKKKFVMIERELKKIARADVRKQGSKPAKEMYEWLLVSLQLRKEAVAARKRLKETADLATLSEEAKQAVQEFDQAEEDSDDPDELEPGQEEEI